MVEKPHQVAVAVDGNTFGHQILANHLFQRVAGHVFGVAVGGEFVGCKVGFAAQLDNTRRQTVGVAQFFVGVCQELGCHSTRMDALGHEMVAPVTQHTDQLSGQRLVEFLQHRGAVGTVASCHGTLFQVGSRNRALAFHDA